MEITLKPKWLNCSNFQKALYDLSWIEFGHVRPKDVRMENPAWKLEIGRGVAIPTKSMCTTRHEVGWRECEESPLPQFRIFTKMASKTGVFVCVCFFTKYLCTVTSCGVKLFMEFSCTLCVMDATPMLASYTYLKISWNSWKKM